MVHIPNSRELIEVSYENELELDEEEEEPKLVEEKVEFAEQQ